MNLYLSINDRIIKLTLKSRFFIHFYGVYAPAAIRSTEDKKKFYNILNNQFKKKKHEPKY